MNAALLTAAVGFAGILVGWFVSGTQRVTEELTKERRESYAEVVTGAEAIDSGSDTDTYTDTDTGEFRDVVLKADFLSSRQMFESGRLLALLDDIGSDEWKVHVDWFRELARFESQRNSSAARWLHQRRYRDLSSVTFRGRQVRPTPRRG